jgi:hypothetical protein
MAPFRKPDRYSQNNRKGQTSVRDADTKAIRGGKGNRKPPQDVQLPHPNEDVSIFPPLVFRIRVFGQLI